MSPVLFGLALALRVLAAPGVAAPELPLASGGTADVRLLRGCQAFTLRVELARALDPARPAAGAIRLEVVDAQAAHDLDARALRDAAALRLAGDPALLRPASSRTDPRGAARTALDRAPVVVTRAEPAWGATPPEVLFAPGSDLGGGWSVGGVTPLERPARAWAWHDGPPGPSVQLCGPVRWSALASLGALLLALAFAAPSLARLVLRAPRPARWTLAVLLAAFLALALLVAPATVMRGNLNGFAHLVSIQQAWSGANDLPATASAAHALLLGLPGALGAPSFAGLVAVNVALGLLAVLTVFLALRAWAIDEPWALGAATALVAANPALGRFAASEDPMPLVVLLAALVAAGVGLAVKHGRAVGLVLAGAAAAVAPWAKAEAALSVSLAALLLAALTGGRALFHGTCSRLALAAGALLLATSLVVFGALLAGDAGAAESATYLAYPWQSVALAVLQFPWLLITHDPLVSPRYVPLALPALALLGLGAAWRRRDGAGLAWLLVLWALFARLYAPYPLPFADDAWATRDHVRLTLHGLVPLALLAAGGAAWLRGRWLAGRPRLTALATLLVVASLAAPAAYWRATWADQDETSFLLEAAHAPERPCLLVTALDDPGACSALTRMAMEPLVAKVDALPQPVEDTTDRLPGCSPGGGPPDPRPLPRLDLALTLLDLEGWRGVPHVAASPALARLPERALACTWYYRGLGAYFDGEQPDGLRPSIRAFESTLGLQPVRTTVSRAERYGFQTLATAEREIGFFRITRAEAPGGRHGP